MENFCVCSQDYAKIFKRCLESGFEGKLTIYEHLEKNPNIFSQIKSWIDQNNLDTLLKSNYILTVALPDNNTLKKLSEKTKENLLQNKTLLSKIIKNHIFHGALDEPLLQSMDGISIKSISNEKYLVNVDDFDITLCYQGLFNAFNPSEGFIDKHAKIKKVCPTKNGIILIVNNLFI